MDDKIYDSFKIGYDAGMKTCLNLTKMLKNNHKGILGEDLYFDLRDIVARILNDLSYDCSEEELEELRSHLIEE